MFSLVVGLVVGLLVGWNLLPQPAFVKKWWDAAVEFFRGRFPG